MSGVVVDAIVILQQPCDRAVVEVRFRLRLVKLVLQHERTAAQLFKKVRDRFPFAARVAHRLHHAARRDGARIDERSRRVVVLEQDGHDRVERQPGRIGADLVEHRIGPVLLHGQDSRRNLRHRFDAEHVIRIAGLDDLSVGQADRNAEKLRRDIGQKRYVIGILTAVVSSEFLVSLVDGLVHLLSIELLHDQIFLSFSLRLVAVEPVAVGDTGLAAEAAPDGAVPVAVGVTGTPAELVPAGTAAGCTS